MTCQGCDRPLTGRRVKWCSESCRKAAYGDRCVGCGRRTAFGAQHARVPEPRCRRCADAHRSRWPAPRILEAIRAWNDLYGEPPGMVDWTPYQARRIHDKARARRFEDAGGRWPSVRVICNRFGSWNSAMCAAGFEPRSKGGGDGNNERRRDRRAVQ